MGEFLFELLLKPLFEILLQIIGYYTARILLPIVTLTYISVAPTTKGKIVFPKWHGLNRADNGKIIIHEEMGAAVGILFWLILLLITTLLFY